MGISFFYSYKGIACMHHIAFQIFYDTESRCFMDFLLWIGMILTCQGIAGLCGVQNIPQKYKGHSWTIHYKRANGVASLMEGIPWIVIAILKMKFPIPGRIVIAAIFLSAVPSLVYSIFLAKIYNKKWEQETAENSEVK